MTAAFLSTARGENRLGSTLVIVALGSFAAVLAALIGLAAYAVAYTLVVGQGRFGLPGFLLFLDSLMATDALKGSAVLIAILAFVVLTNGPLALGFVWVARLVRRRPLLSFLTAARRFRWRLVLIGAVVYLVALAAILPLDAGASIPADAQPFGTGLGFGARLAAFVAVAVLIVLAAGAEELFFRGWLLQQTAAFIRHPVPLMVISGVTFSVVHLDPNLDAFLTRAAMGAGFAWMTLRTGGVELALGAHTGNNLLLLMLIGSMPLAPEAPHAFELQALLAPVLVLGMTIGITEAVMRWAPLRRWSGVDLAQAPAAA